MTKLGMPSRSWGVDGDAGKKISYEFGGSWVHVLGDILHSSTCAPPVNEQGPLLHCCLISVVKNWGSWIVFLGLMGRHAWLDRCALLSQRKQTSSGPVLINTGTQRGGRFISTMILITTPARPLFPQRARQRRKEPPGYPRVPNRDRLREHPPWSCRLQLNRRWCQPSHASLACGDGPEIMKFGRCGGRLGYKATDLEGERLD